MSLWEECAARGTLAGLESWSVQVCGISARSSHPVGTGPTAAILASGRWGRGLPLRAWMGRGLCGVGRGDAEVKRRRPNRKSGARPRRRAISSQSRSPLSNPWAGPWTEQSRVGGPGSGIREGHPPAVPYLLN